MEHYTAQELLNELITRIEESSVVISPGSIDRLVSMLSDVDVPLKDSKMYFIINDDIEVNDNLHLKPGDRLHLNEMTAALKQCSYVQAYVFVTSDAAKNWLAE